MKPLNLLFDIHKFIPSLSSFHYRKKPCTLRDFVFVEETPTKDISIECTYSIVHEHHEILF